MKNLLDKREIVQKSFRIDKKLDIALSELSSILNRSQNELIDFAIRLLIKENGRWFGEKFVDEYYNKINNNIYEPYSEKINDLELLFKPFDFSTREGAFLILNENEKNGNTKEIYRCNVHNYPGTNGEIANSLGEIAKIVGRKYPELQEKYNIVDIDV